MPKKSKKKQKKSGKVLSRAVPARASKSAADSRGNGKARLFFPPSQSTSGFTSADISQFNDRNARPVVRELIQNSLDAVISLSRRPAVVHFHVENHPRDSIPGLSEYKKAFEAARAKHESNSIQGNAADVIADIAKGLEAETMPFLFIEDNGVGLDEKRMEAILSDGVNVKEGKAIGAFGNGHLPVFCQSQLRYVLYGGVVDGRMIASGHAILASHPGPGNVRLDKSGYYAIQLSKEDDKHNVYPENGQIDNILKKRLERIRAEFGSGTVVAVPGFNHFGNRMESIAEEVKKIAALNFFPAIHNGELEIRVSENNKIAATLTKANLADCLDNYQDDKSGGRGGFPIGIKAASAYRTMREGVEYSVPVGGGKIRLFLRQGAGVNGTRVTFCRNGMWVTDRVRKLAKGEFRDHIPFDALLLANVDEGKGFHDLMARAEGPLHIDLITARFDPADKQFWHDSLDTVRDFLRNEVAKSESERFMSDFYTIETGEAVGGGARSASLAMRGKAEADAGTFAHAAAVRSKLKRKGVKSARNTPTGKTMPRMRIMARSTGEVNTKFICFAFPEDCDDCELRMHLDNGRDPTCTGDVERTQLFIREATLDGRSLPLTGEAGQCQGIILGGAKENDRRMVSVEFEPGQLRESSPQAIACEFYRRAGRPRSGEEAELQ